MIKVKHVSKGKEENHDFVMQEFVSFVQKIAGDKPTIVKIRVGNCLFETDNMEEFEDMCLQARNPILKRAFNDEGIEITTN